MGSEDEQVLLCPPPPTLYRTGGRRKLAAKAGKDVPIPIRPPTFPVSSHVRDCEGEGLANETAVIVRSYDVDNLWEQ